MVEESTVANAYDEPEFGPEMWTHAFLDAVALECHREMAQRLTASPELLRIPRENITRWLATGNYDEGERRSLLAWQPYLDEHRMPDLVKLMTAADDRGQQMRQSTPFAGILRPGERNGIRRKLAEQFAHEQVALG